MVDEEKSNQECMISIEEVKRELCESERVFKKILFILFSDD